MVNRFHAAIAFVIRCRLSESFSLKPELFNKQYAKLRCTRFCSVNIMSEGKYKALWLEGDRLVVIDQTKLPFSYTTKQLISPQDAIDAIADMTVRGAGVIGNVGAFGVYLAVIATGGNLEQIQAIAQQIRAARPTAVNLAWAVDRMLRVLAKSHDPIADARAEAIKICDEDVENTLKIGNYGCDVIARLATAKAGKTVNILTHCNAGWLAIVDRGTALAPIYEAQDRGIDVHVWVDETRPRNQGANLTAWELGQQGIKHTLIADNTGGLLMQSGMVDMCIVGADRVTRAGDVANKIGTYLKALAAQDNQVPFYVALPASTLDMAIADGKEVPIETRSSDEILYMQGMNDAQAVIRIRIAPNLTPAINYGFDVTPARLVTGLITERGICHANEQAIKEMFSDLL
jgi:methylthioribose-1-phosphate isomerase